MIEIKLDEKQTLLNKGFIMNKWETLKQRAKDLNENYEQEVADILYEDICTFHTELQALNESEECNIDGNEVLMLGVNISMEKLAKSGKKIRAHAKKKLQAIKAAEKAKKK